MSNRAFSLVEILVAMIFLALALLSLVWMNQASTKGAMDAYYEFTAFSLAMEPIEIFRGMGYSWIKEYGKSIPELPDYPIRNWVQVADNMKLNQEVSRPAEAALFSRYIDLEPITGEGNLQGVKVTVTVRPANLNRVLAYLSRREVKISALIFERPL